MLAPYPHTAQHASLKFAKAQERNMRGGWGKSSCSSTEVAQWIRGKTGLLTRSSTLLLRQLLLHRGVRRTGLWVSTCHHNAECESGRFKPKSTQLWLQPDSWSINRFLSVLPKEQGQGDRPPRNRQACPSLLGNSTEELCLLLNKCTTETPGFQRLQAFPRVQAPHMRPQSRHSSHRRARSQPTGSAAHAAVRHGPTGCSVSGGQRALCS